MKVNVGTVDRGFRIVLGLSLISLVFFGEYVIGRNVMWGWIGIVPLATAMFRFCPAYLPLRIKT